MKCPNICFRFVQLGFFAAQLLSWYIILNYSIVILPNAKPTKNVYVNWALILVNYLIHFYLIFNHHMSHWKIFLSDPGYYNTHFITKKLDVPQNNDEQIGVAKDNECDQQSVDVEGGEQEEARNDTHPSTDDQPEPPHVQQAQQDDRIPYHVIDRAEQQKYDKFMQKQSVDPTIQSNEPMNTNEDLEAHLLGDQDRDTENPPSITKYTIGLRENNKSFFGWRWCKKCDDLKPPRTHHCSVCQCCVMRMDHHCPWTGNCIGLKTHKYFVCFLFWTIMACMHVCLSAALLNGTWKFWNRVNYSDQFLKEHRPFNPIITPILAFSVSLGVLVLFCMHWGFIARNETTIEYGELMMVGNPFRLRESSANAAQIMGHVDGPGWFQPYIPGKTFKDRKTGEIKPNTNYLNGLSYQRVE